MKKEINDLLLKMQAGEICIGETTNKLSEIIPQYTEREVDFDYLCGVFNVAGIDGLHNEIQRLKGLGVNPHDIIDGCKK